MRVARMSPWHPLFSSTCDVGFLPRSVQRLAFNVQLPHHSPRAAQGKRMGSAHGTRISEWKRMGSANERSIANGKTESETRRAPAVHRLLSLNPGAPGNWRYHRARRCRRLMGGWRRRAGAGYPAPGCEGGQAGDAHKWSTAYESAISDFEDGVQIAAAISMGLNIIVTRNTDDYTGSLIPTLTPTRFLSRFASLAQDADDVSS